MIEEGICAEVVAEVCTQCRTVCQEQSFLQGRIGEECGHCGLPVESGAAPSRADTFPPPFISTFAAII